LLCLLVGALFAFSLYWRSKQLNDNTKTERWLNGLLAAIRFVTISVLAFLLLSPFIKSKFNEIEQPLIIIAQDNSASMLLDLHREDSLLWVNQMQEFMKQLEDKYELRKFHFGNELKPGFLFHPEENATDLSAVFNTIKNRFGNQHIGAIVIATDGIINQGIDPAAAHRLPDAPIFTIGMGDTVPKKDLLITNVQANQIVYLHDIFEIQTDIKAYHADGEETSLVLSLINKGNNDILESRSLEFKDDPEMQKLRFKLEATQPGLHHYRMSINPLSDEISEQNNAKDFFIDVLDSREKILILAASPHPDIAAIKHALLLNENYTIDVKMIQDFRDQINDYDILIAYQIPAVGSTTPALMNLLSERDKPTWYILGSQSDIAALERVQPLLKIVNNQGNTDEATALVNQHFNDFKLPDGIGDINNYPPLIVPFGQYKTSIQSETILYQKLGNIVTDYPLLLQATGQGARKAILCGEGLWKWRLFEYAKAGNNQMIDQMIRQIVQFLSVRNDKRKFRLELSKNLFNEGESVTMNAYLYNDNYELTNEPEIDISITDTSGKNYQFIMTRQQQFYSLNAGKFPSGDYEIKASVRYQDLEQQSEARFSVVPLQLENLNTVANHMLLHKISNATGGRFYLPEQLKSLSNQLLNKEPIKPLIKTRTSTYPLINLKWIFFLLISLLSIEWFLRKWRGAY